MVDGSDVRRRVTSGDPKALLDAAEDGDVGISSQQQDGSVESSKEMGVAGGGGGQAALASRGVSVCQVSMSVASKASSIDKFDSLENEVSSLLVPDTRDGLGCKRRGVGRGIP